ncbi:hypothetical protein ANCCAN_22699, partial [Ancylostoma caninum]
MVGGCVKGQTIVLPIYHLFWSLKTANQYLASIENSDLPLMSEPSSEGDERPPGVKRRARGSSSESRTRRRARRARTRRLQLEGTLLEARQRPRQAPRPAAPPPPPPLNIRAPKETKMRGTFDPNYQTLAGLNNEDVFKPKDGGQAFGGGAFNIRPPAETGMKGTFDPNYQTLAGLNNDEDGGLGVGGGGNLKIRPPTDNRGRKVATFDPNYQTLAGLNNEDVFKPK